MTKFKLPVCKFERYLQYGHCRVRNFEHIFNLTKDVILKKGRIRMSNGALCWAIYSTGVCWKRDWTFVFYFQKFRWMIILDKCILLKIPPSIWFQSAMSRLWLTSGWFNTNRYLGPDKMCWCLRIRGCHSYNLFEKLYVICCILVIPDILYDMKINI